MISVIMPVYNVEDYVAEAIESVRQQSYGEWELLLIDDGSTDESSKICKAYAEKEEKIRYIRKENEEYPQRETGGCRKRQENGSISWMRMTGWIRSVLRPLWSTGNWKVWILSVGIII